MSVEKSFFSSSDACALMSFVPTCTTSDSASGLLDKMRGSILVISETIAPRRHSTSHPLTITLPTMESPTSRTPPGRAAEPAGTAAGADDDDGWVVPGVAAGPATVPPAGTD